MAYIKFTFSAVLPLVTKCLWSSLSLKKTEERPGSLPSPSGSAIGIHLAFYKNLRSGLGTEKFSASRDFDTYSLKRN